MEINILIKLLEEKKYEAIKIALNEMNEFDIVGCCSDICVFDGAMGLAGYLDQNNRRHIKL